MAAKANKQAIERADFTALLADVKRRVQSAQTRAVLAVNSELVRLYWDVGRLIDQRQKSEGWGTAVIPRLALELKNEMPELKGFSERNIGLMIAFYREYPCPDTILQQPVAKLPSAENATQAAPQLLAQPFWAIPWGHHVLLTQKIKDLATRRWYMEQTLANGWSRNILALQIDARAHA